MINPEMRDYLFYTFGTKDEYGQDTISQEPVGAVNIAIFTQSQTIGTNIKYKDATYLGITKSKAIDDTYVILYGDEMLKVLYTTPSGRFTQVFLAEM